MRVEMQPLQPLPPVGVTPCNTARFTWWFTIKKWLRKSQWAQLDMAATTALFIGVN